MALPGSKSAFGNVLGGAIGQVAGPALLGVLGGKTAAEKNKADIAANQANIAAQAANQARATSALGLTGPFGGPKPDPKTGGFVSVQPGGEDAARARSTLALGDVGRAGRLNLAGDQFQYTLPNLESATNIARRDVGRQQGTFDKSVQDLVASRQRTGQGMANEPFHAATVDALKRAADEFNVGVETTGLNIYNRQREADVGLLAAIQAANQPQAGFPAFTSGGPGATAANVIAQTPPRTQISDIRGAVPYQAAGGVVQDVMTAERAREDNRNFLEAIRHLRDVRA
jgi:hypothetical protein